MTQPSIVQFYANRNSSNTTIADATNTTIPFPNETYDVGNYFVTDSWTPPSGVISLSASLYITGSLQATTAGGVGFFKNAAQFAQTFQRQQNGDVNSHITCLDTANGTDVYQAYGFCDTTGSSATVSGITRVTYFTGRSLEATFGSTAAFMVPSQAVNMRQNVRLIGY